MMMMKIWTFACLAQLLHGGLGAPDIEPSLMKALQRGGTADVLVTMRDSTSTVLEGFKGRNFPTRGDRITAIATELQELAATSQANVIAFLEEELSGSDGGGSYRPFWISNQIFIRGASQELVEKLRDFNEIESIAEAESIGVGEASGWTSEQPSTRDSDQSPPTGWNIARISAPEVWHEERNNGTGITVATIDFGVRGTHEALQRNYRHEYGWFDVNGRTREPRDDHNLGTSVMGTLVGSGGIGVAPGSQWMSCRLCTRTACSSDAPILCGQWVLCPTDPEGGNPNCSMAPHVVSMSWIFNGNSIKRIIDAWHTAGIIPVFVAGRNGRNCSSLEWPADYDKVLGVGATDCTDSLTEWSSVGPSRRTSEFKPDVVAPATQIYSAGSGSDTDYRSRDSSGWTAPHVAGTVALMLASRPQDRPCFESVRDALRQSSEPIRSQGLTCDGVGDHQRPNYHHGYGLINALRAVRIYKNMTLSCS